MPIYDYKCNECDHEFEVMHKMSEVHTVCKKCGKEDITKQLTTASLIMKGQGFYAGGFHSNK